jgi:hypothetical protein
LVYSSAEYPKNDDFLNFELGDVKVLPGCEGSSKLLKRKMRYIYARLIKN